MKILYGESALEYVFGKLVVQFFIRPQCVKIYGYIPLYHSNMINIFDMDLALCL